MGASVRLAVVSLGAALAVGVPGSVAATSASAAGAAAVSGFHTCPSSRPAATGTLALGSRSGRVYAGFAAGSTGVLCRYSPVKTLNVTVASNEGAIGLPPGIGPTTTPPGVHDYVLLGRAADGTVVALTQQVVGAAQPEAEVAPTAVTPAQQPTAAAGPEPGVDVVVAIRGTSAPGAGDGPGAGGGPGSGDEPGVLARTGGFLAMLAGEIGLLLVLAGAAVVLATRPRRRVRA